MHLQKNHRGRPGIMFRRLAAARLKHLHTSDRVRLDQKGVVYVIYNCKDDASGYRLDVRRYVGLTHLSALQRFHSHISSAKSYLRRPSGGRNIFQKAHLMYRIWGSQGLKDYAVFLLKCALMTPNTDNTCSAKEFARRYKDREAFWIDTLKTLETRGFNVRNERPVKCQVNFFRRQKQKAQRRATMAQHSDGLSTMPSTSTPAEAMHGSIAMPGAHRNSSYARTAHTLLAEIQRQDHPPLPSSL